MSQKYGNSATNGMNDLPFDRIYLDTNILISAFGGDAEPDIALQLLEIIEAILPGKYPPCVTSELTLAEMLVRPLRVGAEEQVRSFDNVLTTSAWLEVEPVTRSVIWGAASLRARHSTLKLPDALHVATAIYKRCSHFLTADLGIKASYSVVVHDDGEQHISAPVNIIRPDIQTLAELLGWLRK